MSKRRRKARGRTGELPLDSPNLMPAAEAHRLLTGLLDNPSLAAKDLTAAVAAKRSDKRLPCMRRLLASEVASDQDRKIVPLSFGFDPVSQKLRVWEREDVGAPAYLHFDRAYAAFFVWRPKFEKFGLR
jgi:hypothetical protein